MKPTLTDSLDDLAPGDVVEILYRVWKPVHPRGAAMPCEDVADRWIPAVVVACEPATWPLVRLADGQATEIRPFMPWRLVARAERRPWEAAA